MKRGIHNDVTLLVQDNRDCVVLRLVFQNEMTEIDVKLRKEDALEAGRLLLIAAEKVTAPLPENGKSARIF